MTVIQYTYMKLIPVEDSDKVMVRDNDKCICAVSY